MPVNDASFSDFVTARYASLARSAYLLTADRHEAEDLVQATLLRVYPSWQRLEAPEAYVRTAMVRLALRRRRRLWRHEVPTEHLPETARDTDPSTHVALATALATLSLPHRAVLVLRHLHGLSEAETATALGCSVGTVKSRNARALAALRTSGLLDEEEAPRA